MASFNDLLKKYKYEVTNQDPEEWLQNADYAGEELIDNLQEYQKNKDADQFMAYIIQAMNEYFIHADDRYEKRKALKQQQSNPGESFDQAVTSKINKFSS